MTRKFPIAAWQDAEGWYTASVLDGMEASALDRTLADCLAQLKKYLAWELRNGELVDADFDDLSLSEHHVRVRPGYEVRNARYPVSTPFTLRVTCVHGSRKDGTRHCVAPTLDVRFSHQPNDPLEELLTEAVQQKLGKLTPQELSRELMPARITLDAVHLRDGRPRRDAATPQFRALQSVAEPLGGRVRRARVPRPHQRDEQVRLLIDRLINDRANLLLLGDAGIGKTTVVVEAIRQALRAAKQKKKTDPSKADAVLRQFWRTSGQRLIAGMQYLGQWEERCERVIEELSETSSVLCVEDLLELIRVGGREPGASVAAFLMPYLARGELRMIAEATPSELDACRRLLPGLADLFQIVRIPEFSAADARGVLGTLWEEGGRNSKLELGEGLADLVYRLFKRFQPYAAFPGRAAAFVRHLLDEAAQSGRLRIDTRHVLARFQRETGLPERLLRDDLPLPHEQVLADFRRAVLGQESACQTAAAVVTSLKTGLNDPGRPLGVLLFCGPTGVGKTEMAKALARYLFGAGAVKDRLVRLDMSEYSGLGAAQRLLMSADGQVSDFIKRLRRQPFVVVLLDEIEKAAPEVHDVLLGMLDEGRLTDRFGRVTTFHSAVIVMTSNLGAERSAVVGFDGTALPAFERIAMGTFRPEFFNRIDGVITFQPLSRETILALAERELQGIAQRDGLTKLHLRLSWTPALVEHLAALGYDRRYGARPLQRAIEQHVVGPFSHWLLTTSVRDRRLMLDLDDKRELTISVLPQEVAR